MALSVIVLVILALSGSLALLLIGATLRRRRTPGAMLFTLLLCGELFWTAGAGLELLVSSLDAKLATDLIQYLGRSLVVASALLFALVYTGRACLLRRAALLLSIEPIATAALLLAEPLHGLTRQSPRLDDVAGVGVLVYGYGPWLLISAAVSYGLMLATLLLLMRHNRGRSQLFRWQSRLVTLGLGAVFVAGLGALAGHWIVPELHYLDLTPLAFAVANPLWAIALFRSRLLDLIPVARDLLIEHIPDALIVVDDQCRVVDLNPRARRLLAGSNEALMGAPLSALLPEVAAHVSGRDSTTTGRIALHPADSGEPVVVEGTVVPLSDQRNRPVGWQIVLRDITAQHQAEEALRKSQLLLQALLEHSPLAVAVREAATGRYLLMNERMQQLLAPHQRSPEDEEGDRLDDPLPADAPAPSSPARQTERTLPLPDGTALTLLETHFPLAERAGPAEAVGSIYLDITARKRAEDRLRESEKRFREVMEHVQLIGIMLDCEGALTFCNDELLHITGWQREQILGKSWFELFVPEEQFSQQQYLRYITAESIPERFENDIRTASGERRRIAWHNTMVRDLRGHVIGTSSIGEDITVRVQTEEQLHASQELLRGILEYAPTAIEVLDAASGRYLLVSDRTAAALGLPRAALLGRTVAELYPPALAAKWQSQDHEIIATGSVLQTEDSVDEIDGVRRTYLGTKFPIYAADGRVAAIGGIYTDITERSHAEVERRRLEQKLQETQRLESLGVLAGGIAHDFNNILAGIMGYAELALMDLEPTSEAHTAVGQIKAGARRAADLTNQMLAYAGKGRFVVRPVQLNSVVREMIELARGTASHHGAVQIDLAESLPQIEADITHIRQIVLNLLVNAAEALGPDGGSITVETSTETLTATDLQSLTLGGDAVPGRYVCLTVRDTGGGMDAETLVRIFDPFFTTKFTGRGLGLAAVHGIVRSHRGLL
ncbi:MAG TPA: PAS domain S-box protein, partial [Roseiflexaceae bacterium]|nr:PAS domain S-box protein [Roseiflexaceae bacterium]